MNATNTENAEKDNQEQVISATRLWLERAVIGLNLCPFAKAVHVKCRIRYVVSKAKTPEQLCADLYHELKLLQAAKPADIDTSLLIHPHVLTDFLDYNDFLDIADDMIEELDLVGEIQIASFHPDYQFAGTHPQDIENYTNRSPYPMLQLLRESSLETAIDSYPDTSKIFENNIETLKKLGFEGLAKLDVFNLKK